jgi:hypothetical protein
MSEKDLNHLNPFNPLVFLYKDTWKMVIITNFSYGMRNFCTDAFFQTPNYYTNIFNELHQNSVGDGRKWQKEKIKNNYNQPSALDTLGES